MASLKALKIRINSVKSTQKITKAMKMVAAAKLRRAQESAQNGRPYAERLEAVMAGMAARVGGVGASPLLACIATARDDRDAWLAAGQALERMLLVAARAGHTASFLNQPIEVADLRKRLAHMLDLGGVPQLLLRIGRGPHTPHSPRRPLDEVVS